MRDLFSMDAKDYNPDGKVFSRPSVRAVIAKDDKVLLVYSKKFDYYKFPGGGLNKGESDTEALLREVQEETGYQVVPESVEEFGRVLRRQKDSYEADHIFEQENRYYFCRAKEELAERNLDDYEAEEGFTAVWADPFEASHHNHYSRNKGGDPVMVEREEKVLNLVDLELRGRKRKIHENETLQALGNPAFAEMLRFVEETLGETNTESLGGAKVDISYSRFEHTKRVLAWLLRLYEQSKFRNEIRKEELIIATIFHDVGRTVADAMNMSHAKAGVPITEKYLVEHGYSKEKVEYICSLVSSHSDKYRMGEDGLDKGLLMLMEADLMDDMGALGVVMDCMITMARNPAAKFTDCMDHINRFTYRQQQDNPMVTPEARKIWDEKTRVVNDFTAALHIDLEL